MLTVGHVKAVVTQTDCHLTCLLSTQTYIHRHKHTDRQMYKRTAYSLDNDDGHVTT